MRRCSRPRRRPRSTGTSRTSTVATAATARRVVRLETPIATRGVEERHADPGDDDPQQQERRLAERRPGALDRVRDEEEELRADRHHEHHAGDRRPLRGEVALHVERACQVEVEHPGAPVGAERLRRDERGEERERHRDLAGVLAVGRQDRRPGSGSTGRKAEIPTKISAGTKAISERDRRQHLVAEAPVQAEHALHGVPPDRDERPDRGAARAVVGPVADVEDARALVALMRSPPCRRPRASGARGRGGGGRRRGRRRHPARHRARRRPRRR